MLTRKPRFLERLLRLSAVLLVGLRLAGWAANLTWTGAAGDGNIMNGQNWNTSQAPASGDALNFGGTVSLNPMTASDLTLTQLSFTNTAWAFTVGGTGSITLSMGMTSNSTNTQTIGNAMILSANQNWQAQSGAVVVNGTVNVQTFNLTSTGNNSLTINGAISGSGLVVQNGMGSLTLTGNNAFTGGVTLQKGTLIIGNNTALGTGTFTIQAAATLDATGGSWTLTNALLIKSSITFLGSDSLTFNGNASVTANSTITVNGSNPLTFGGVISGNGVVTADGTGTLVLNGANTFTGGLSLAGATTVLGTNTSAGTGTLTLNGGAIQAGSSALTIGNTLSIKNSINTVFGGSYNLTFTANENIGTSDTFTVQNGVTSFTGNLGGGGATLTAAGTGTLAMGGTNTFTGGVTIQSATLLLNSNAGAGTGTITVGSNSSSSSAAATLDLSVTAGFTVTNAISVPSGSTGVRTIGALNTSGTNTFSGTISLGTSVTVDEPSGGQLSLTGVISGAGGITIADAGTVQLSNTNTFTGPTNVNAGTLSFGASNVLGSGSVTVNGGVINMGVSHTDTVGAVTLQNGSILGTGTSTLTSTSGFTVQNGTISVILAGSVGLTETTSGAVTLSGVNTYTGTTNINAGTLTFGASNVLPNTALNVSGGTINMGTTYTDTVGAVTLSSGSILGGSGSVLTSSSGFTLQSGTVTAILAGSVGLTKSTTGTVTLSGANTYTGATTVNAGTLILSGGSLAATAVTIAQNATLAVQGNYTIGTSTGGTLTVAGSAVTAPTLNLVDSAISTLTLPNNSATDAFNVGSATAGQNSNLSMEIGATSDSIVVGNGTSKIYIGYGGLATTVNLTGLGNFTGTQQTLISAPGGVDTTTTGHSTFATGFVLGTTTGGFCGYTVALGSDATHLYATETANPAPASAYWSGAASLVTAQGGTTTFSSFVNGNTNTSNFTTDAGGTTNASGLVGGTTNVFFNATGAANYSSPTLGQNLAINSLTFLTSNAVSIGGSNTLTINATNANGNTAGNGITVATGAANDTISTNIILGGDQTWTVTDSSNTLTVSGQISGSHALTKAGSGILLLTAANNFTGAVSISEGTILIGMNNSLPMTAPVALSNGTMLNLSGYNQTLGSVTGTGTISLGNGAITIGDSTNTTFSGLITGTGSVTKTGSGTVTLATANSFTGPVTISAGTLQVQVTGALGGGGASNTVAVQSGATLEMNTLGSIEIQEAISLAGINGNGAAWVPDGYSSVDGPITLTADAAVEVDTSAILAMGAIGQSGSGRNLQKNGSGLLVLNSANTFTGDLIINAGTVQLAANNCFGGLSGLSVAAGATFNLNNFSDSLADLSGAGTVSYGGSGGGTLTVGSGNTNSTFGGAFSGTGTLVKTGTGTLTLSSSNAIPSTVAVTVNNGTLAFGATNQTTGAVSVVSGSISGTTGSLNAPSYTLNNGNVSAKLGGSNSTLTVNGGHSYLSGTNNYGGSTQINSGILEIQPSGSLTATSGVNIAAGAMLIDNGTINSTAAVSGSISGAGSITGTVTVASGGAISPGSDTTVGTFATGALSLTSGGTYTLTLDSSHSTADDVSATGTISLGSGAATLAATDLLTQTLLWGTTFTILQSTSGVTGYFASLPQGTWFNVGNNTYQINYTAAGGNNVTLMVVPEPSPALYCVCGLGIMRLFRRHRRR